MFKLERSLFLSYTIIEKCIQELKGWFLHHEHVASISQSMGQPVLWSQHPHQQQEASEVGGSCSACPILLRVRFGSGLYLHRTTIVHI